ncbi:hypothetical protein R84B8_02060 [Treponema sp. R8-4-B8]
MKNYQLLIRNEQLSISEVSKRGGLPRQSSQTKTLFIANCLPHPAHRPLLLTLPFLLFSFFILLSSCNLFTGPKVDLFQVISDEVDWANAARLTVTVAVPSGWGNSPQFGDGKCGDTRLGYLFNVEFTPNSGYGFRGWLAFKSSEYNQQEIIAMGYEQALAESLNGNGVEITDGEVTNTGAYPGGVTIRVNAPVTLIPFCDNRPQVVRSNPPLIPAITSFPFDQTVSVYFNMAVKQSSVVMGDTVKVSAVYASGLDNGNPFEKFSDGVNIDNGDISQYFTVSFPQADVMYLSVKNTDGYFGYDLKLLNIGVEIGPGVQNLNGITMPAVQTITYLTNSSEAQKVYEAFNIQARRSETGGEHDTAWFQDGERWNDPDIDRRFNWKNAQYDTVYIRFTVTNPEGVTTLPNRFIVSEQVAYSLNGLSASGTATPKTYRDLTPDGGYYYITHKLETAVPGIIRLVIRPWYEDADGANNIMEQDYNEAVNLLHFITAVMDTEAPGGSMTSLGAEITGGVLNDDVYTFNAASDMTFALNSIDRLSDNAGDGIPYSGAYNKPWTMDEWAKLQWRVCVNNVSGDTYTVDSGWLDVQTNQYTGGFSGLTQGVSYTVYVLFRDTMGNVSGRASGGTIKTIAGAPVSASGLSAVVDPTGKGIKLKWTTNPNAENNMTGARVYINEIEQSAESGTGAKTRDIVCTQINADGVRSGQAVSNVQKYVIKIIAYNAAGSAAPVTLSVWNIPGMSVSQTEPAVELTDSNFTSALAADSRTYVLTENADLGAWTPTGTFTGKFYGNGHTVNISGLTAAENMGLFGAVSGETAVVRDLTVQYSGSITRSGKTRFGGIAAVMSGNARLENTLVLGDVSVNVTSDDDMEVGGFAGRMRDSASIKNAYGGLDLKVEHLNASTVETKGSSIYMGGIAGVITGDGINEGLMVNVDNVTVVGNINITANVFFGTYEFMIYDEGLIIGGIAGFVFDAVINDSLYRQGDITVDLISGNLNMGGAFGIIGFSEAILSYDVKFAELLIETPLAAEINNCSAFARTINIIIRKGTAPEVIGGFVGQFCQSKINNCYSENQINVNADQSSLFAQLYTGGFVGYILNSNISYCYSKNDVNVYVTKSGTYASGFAARADVSTIKYCYASGNVSLVCISEGEDGIAGGLAGHTGSSVVEGCYSLGNVFIDSNGSYMSAGGLIGFAAGGNYKNNFSAGAVTAQVDGAAGGLFGTLNGTSQNNVALGTSVTITSSGTAIGRVYGNKNGTSSTNNYANSDMTLLSRTNNNAAWNTTTVTPSAGGAATKDGDNKYEGDFRKPTFWKGLGFSDDDWIFSTTVGMRHPILKTKDGKEMGGQR